MRPQLQILENAFYALKPVLKQCMNTSTNSKAHDVELALQELIHLVELQDEKVCSCCLQNEDTKQDQRIKMLITYKAETPKLKTNIEVIEYTDVIHVIYEDDEMSITVDDFKHLMTLFRKVENDIEDYPENFELDTLDFKMIH